MPSSLLREPYSAILSSGTPRRCPDGPQRMEVIQVEDRELIPIPRPDPYRNYVDANGETVENVGPHIRQLTGGRGRERGRPCQRHTALIYARLRRHGTRFFAREPESQASTILSLVPAVHQTPHALALLDIVLHSMISMFRTPFQSFSRRGPHHAAERPHVGRRGPPGEVALLAVPSGLQRQGGAGAPQRCHL